MTHRENQEIISMEDFGQFLFDDYEVQEEKEEKDEVLDIEGALNEEEEEKEDIVNEDTFEEQEESEEQENQVPTQNNFSLVIEDFIKSEEWQDYRIEHGEKEYESILDLIKEVEITPELFKALVNTQTEGKIKKLQESAVILEEGIDPTRAELVKAIASGLTEYEPFIQTYDNIIEPLKNLDLSEQQTATALIAKYYKEVNKWEDGYIAYKIETHKKQLELEEIAESIRKEYIGSFQEILQQKQEEENKQKQELVQKVKENKKSFKDYLKSNEYDDPFIAKALPLMFAEDGGEPHWYKELQNRMKDNPEFKAKLAHWILNEEDYLNKKMAPKKREEKLKTLNTINILSASKKKTPEVSQEEGNVLDIFGKS